MNLTKEKQKKIRKKVESLIKRKCHVQALNLIGAYKLRGYTITKGRAKKEYGLSEKQILKLPCNEVDNPYYKSSSPMKLYLIAQCELKAKSAKMNMEKELFANRKIEVHSQRERNYSQGDNETNDLIETIITSRLMDKLTPFIDLITFKGLCAHDKTWYQITTENKLQYHCCKYNVWLQRFDEELVDVQTIVTDFDMKELRSLLIRHLTHNSEPIKEAEYKKLNFNTTISEINISLVGHSCMGEMWFDDIILAQENIVYRHQFVQ